MGHGGRREIALTASLIRWLRSSLATKSPLSRSSLRRHAPSPSCRSLAPSDIARKRAARGTSAQRLVAAAYAQVGVTLAYDPSYRRIAFPGGDVPPERGVCSDVVVRAYRGLGIDLQRLVNDDMRQAFSAYPHLWGLAHPDPNIDHRRVPNLATFIARHGATLALSGDAKDYRPGDVVTWVLPGNLAHIGIVSDRKIDDRPLMVHNIGAGAQVEDVLFAYPITGHYRYLP
jgi:uncharacterized protein YijF (DUF1287 family)